MHLRKTLRCSGVASAFSITLKNPQVGHPGTTEALKRESATKTRACRVQIKAPPTREENRAWTRIYTWGI